MSGWPIKNSRAIRAKTPGISKVLLRGVLLISVLGVFIISGGCSPKDECPACPSLPNIIQLHSGTGSSGGPGDCPFEEDPLTIVTSDCGGPPEPALIWGGNTGSLCECVNDSHEIGSDYSHPVSPVCSDAVGAIFTRAFTLPENFRWAHMELAIAADDWAEVFLNDNSIGVIEFPETQDYPSAPAIIVLDSSLFTGGENTLRFEVFNGSYPEPRPRSSAGDCFWLEYSGTVEYGF
jgi:hypothetical protein